MNQRKNIWKRIFSLCLALVLVVGLVPSTVPVKAEAAVKGDGTYTWPVTAEVNYNHGYYYNNNWGNPDDFHGGMDFPVSKGSSVYAIASGTVITATDNGCLGSHGSATQGRCPYETDCKAVDEMGTTGSYANWIVIDHGNGITSLYAHLHTDSFLVNVGDYVYQGQIIAKSGNAGNTGGRTGEHLHLEIRNNNTCQVAENLLTQKNVESGVPVGSLDNASFNKDTNTLTVSGWTLDPDDINRELTVNIVVNGKVIGTGVANGPREDIGTQWGGSPYHGFQWEFQLPENIPGIQRVEARAVDQERGKDFMFGGKRVEFGPSGDNIPFGSLDEVILNKERNTITVRGWAADPDDFDRVVDVHIVLDGETIGHAFADLPRQDLQDGQGIGAYHGFDFECPIPEGLSGVHNVEAHGIDVETNRNYLFSSTPVDFGSNANNTPFGALDTVLVDNNRILVRGWAADPDDFNRAVDVHIVINGKTVGHALANLPRQDLQEGQGIGANHGFEFECPVADDLTGLQTIEAHGIDLEYGYNVQFDSKTVTIPGPCNCSPGFKGTYVTMAPVTIHSGHNSQFSVLGTIPAGTRIEISKAKGLQPDQFGHVTYNGITGFVSMEHVRMDLGEDFYAYIILQTAWNHLTNDLPNVSLRDGTGAPDQVWHFLRQDDGSYKIISVADGTALDVDNASGEPGANVKTHQDKGGNAQRWLIGGTQSQYFLSSKCGPTVLEVPDTAYPSGTNVAMGKFTGNHNQRFHIWKLEDYAPSVPPKPEITFSPSKYGMADGEYQYQEPITVSWNAPNSTSYWLQIKNNKDDTYIINEMVTTNSYTFSPPNIGTFTVAMRAYNHAGDSGRIDRTLTVHGLTGRIWASETAQGPEQAEFPKGSQVFLNFSLIDPHSGKYLYDYLENYHTQVTLTLWDASGSALAAQSFENEDGAAFSCGTLGPGTYTLTVESNRQSIFYISTVTFTVAECTHAYVPEVTPPTCIEGGYTTYTCASCGDSYVSDEVPALGHNMSQWAVSVEAGCVTPGQEHTECVREGCGYEENREIPALGHNYESQVTAPTCTEEGYTTHICSRCGNSYVDTYVEALGHSFGEWTVVIEPSCTQEGVEQRICELCGHQEERNFPGFVHRYDAVIIEPTCTEGGYTTYTCASCGDSYVSDEVPALGHNMSQWAVSVEAGCEAPGQEHTECVREGCDHEETRELPALGHDLSGWHTVTEAGCETEGLEKNECTRCDFAEENVLPALGHDFVDGVCSRCGEKADEDMGQILVQSVQANPGESVAVTISLKNNPGLTSLKLNVTFDEILTLTNVEFNSDIGGQSMPPVSMDSPVMLNWFHGLEDVTGDFTFVTLTFQVAEDAQPGAEAAVSVTYNPSDLFNLDEQNVRFEVVNGKITVSSHVPGDISGDGELNNKDLTRLFRYLSGYPVEVNEAALDITGDGEINNKDLTRLFRYLSGYPVEIQ